MSYIRRGTATYRRANAALFAGGFVTFAILYSVQPVLPALGQRFHVSATVASLSLSVTTATLALCMLAAAGVSETSGRKVVMTAALFATSLLCILVALSPNFGILLTLRALQGVALAGLPAIAMAYVSEEFDPATMGTAMGLYISGNSIGGLSGRIIVSNLADTLSWEAALAILGLIGLAASAGFVAALPRERRFERQRADLRTLLAGFAHHLSEPGLLCLFCSAFLLMGSFVTLWNYLGFLLINPPYSLSQTSIGWIFAVYLTGTVSSAWMGRLADRFGRRRVLPVTIVLALAGALASLAPPLAIKIAAISLFTFGFFGAHSVASGWVGQRARHNRAQASSLYLLFYYLGSSIVGTAGGEFWVYWGWDGVISLISALLLLCLCLSMFLARIAAVRPYRVV